MNEKNKMQILDLGCGLKTKKEGSVFHGTMPSQLLNILEQ